MPEVPRDPRQLARDILSGKISIEDIARERQNRAGRAPPPRPPTAAPQARTPQRIPLPKQQQSTSPPPVQRPFARPPAPVQRPRQPVPQQKAKPLQKPRPQQQPAPQPSIQMAQSAQTKAYDAPKAIQDAKVIVAVTNKPLLIRTLTQNRTALRQGLLMSEILGKPLALRDIY